MEFNQKFSNHPRTNTHTHNNHRQMARDLCLCRHVCLFVLNHYVHIVRLCVFVCLCISVCFSVFLCLIVVFHLIRKQNEKWNRPKCDQRGFIVGSIHMAHPLAVDMSMQPLCFRQFACNLCKCVVWNAKRWKKNLHDQQFMLTQTETHRQTHRKRST